jgi:hypothetical protein
MGSSTYLNRKQYNFLRDALEIAEDLTGEHYGISRKDWKRYPYDLKTLEHLRKEEVTDMGFAQLAKYMLEERGRGERKGISGFYRICIQDHVILNALNRNDNILLEPLLLYIVTHELVHIIRFSHYIEDYFAKGEKRKKEEREVHGITYEVLKDFEYEGLEEVVKAYEWARAACPQ